MTFTDEAHYAGFGRHRGPDPGWIFIIALAVICFLMTIANMLPAGH